LFARRRRRRREMKDCNYDIGRTCFAENERDNLFGLRNGHDAIGIQQRARGNRRRRCQFCILDFHCEHRTNKAKNCHSELLLSTAKSKTADRVTVLSIFEILRMLATVHEGWIVTGVFLVIKKRSLALEVAIVYTWKTQHILIFPWCMQLEHFFFFKSLFILPVVGLERCRPVYLAAAAGLLLSFSV
jgi:hypothetical protein